MNTLYLIISILPKIPHTDMRQLAKSWIALWKLIETISIKGDSLLFTHPNPILGYVMKCSGNISMALFLSFLLRKLEESRLRLTQPSLTGNWTEFGNNSNINTAVTQPL